MKYAAIAFMACLAMAGCETTKRTPVSSVDDPTYSCLNTLAKDEKLAKLAGKIGAVQSANITLEALSSQDKASQDDKPILSHWMTARGACVDAGKQFRAQNQPPQFAGLYEAAHEELVILTARLYAGELTYGQFNMARKASTAKYQDLWRDANNKHMQAARQDAAVNAQRAAEFNNALLLMQAAQPRPMQQPAFSTHCRSRNVSGTIYTDCQ